MNGNVYILIAYEYSSDFNSEESILSEELSKGLETYFDNDLKVWLIPSTSNITKVYIMDKPLSPENEVYVKGYIINYLSIEYDGFKADEVDFKFNYSRFNPNFNPLNMDLEKRFNKKIKEVGNQVNNKTNASKADEFNYEKLSQNYTAEEPRYSFDQVIISPKTLEQIENAVGVIQVEEKVFDEWGLRAIIPSASSALSFYGPPGTGKSMVAEALANKLGKKILRATYADIESKYHGEGPKMVKAIFKAAERDDAVLFLDESDSLLSKRLTNVSDGSAQAINSMRSQLLISLEHFKGIVIFATNLVVNYDKAFLSRLINIEFTLPSADDRERIWWQHLKTDKVHVPLGSDVDVRYLADTYEFCGREIKNAVKSACIAAALEKREEVLQSDFIKACETTKEQTLKAVNSEDHTDSKDKPTYKKKELTDTQKSTLIDIMQKQIDSKKSEQIEEQD